MIEYRSARRALLVGLAAAAALPGIALGQTLPTPKDTLGCPSAPPTYQFLRYLDDFQSLRDPACRTNPWDDMKYIAFGENGDRGLTLGADARFQLINARNLSFGNEGGDNHNVFLQRYHAHASLRWGNAFRLFAELKSDHEHGREPGPLPADVDLLDIHQAFIDLGGEPSPALLRVGRQELLYGSGRRIFPRNGPNVRGNFDAVRLLTRPGDWRADAFVFHPVAVDPGRFDDDTIDTQTFWGVYATGPQQAIAPALLDLYYIGANREGARFQQGVAYEHRQTVGARLYGRVDAWDHDHEMSLQWGRFGAGSIRAWAVASETGYSWADVPRRPRVSIRADVGSGDRDAADPDLQTFNSLFPRGGAVDEGFNVSAANTTHLRAAVSFGAWPAVRATIAVNAGWRTSRRDGVYGPGGGLILSGASTARHVGNSIDVFVVWAINRHATLDFGVGYFAGGRFAKEAAAKPNMAYATPTFHLRF
jgi:hypothetical protein